MASSADHRDSTFGDLASVVLVGVFAASLQQLIASDRITRTARHRVVRWLAKEPETTIRHHLQYALGCWDCGPMWGALIGHLIRRRHGAQRGRQHRTLAGLVVATISSRAVARVVADHIGWSGGFKADTLPDGTKVFMPSFGRDWPNDIAWVGDRVETPA